MKPASGFRTLIAAAALAPALLGTPPAAADEAAWQRLAAGGQVVLMRHAAVEPGRDAGDPLTRDPSCAKERNLSDRGRREARAAGEQFRARRIPVAAVRHSPYCRAAETARLAFGAGEPAEYLSLREVLGPEDAARQTAELNRAIGSWTGPGNLVLVTHEPNINAVAFEGVRPGQMLVLKPRGGGEFEELGLLNPGGAD